MASEDAGPIESAVTLDPNSLLDPLVPVFSSSTRLPRIIPPSRRKEIRQLAKEGINGTSNPVLSICKSLFSGGVAGGVSRTAVAPLERLKILLQTIILAVSSADRESYFHSEPNPMSRLVVGACAGTIAMSATYPMDLVRGRISVQTEKSPYQYKGMLHALSTVLEKEGPRALYRGWLPSALGVVPYVVLNFSVYEFLKEWLIKSKPFGVGKDSELSVTTRLACGAASGTVGQTVAYPLDVIRRRMQMAGWHNAASVVTVDGTAKPPVEYCGMIDAFRKTVRHEGFSALYKGLVPYSLKVVPSITVAFVTYEVVKDILGVQIPLSD